MLVVHSSKLGPSRLRTVCANHYVCFDASSVFQLNYLSFFCRRLDAYDFGIGYHIGTGVHRLCE